MNNNSNSNGNNKKQISTNAQRPDVLSTIILNDNKTFNKKSEKLQTLLEQKIRNKNNR